MSTNSEEDTFRKLRQVPFKEVKRMLDGGTDAASILDKLRQRAGKPPARKPDFDYEAHGWTYEEYLDEWRKQFPDF